MWCSGGLIIGFLYLADHTDDPYDFVIRSRVGLSVGALAGFLGFVLPLILPTKAEREKEG